MHAQVGHTALARKVSTVALRAQVVLKATIAPQRVRHVQTAMSALLTIVRTAENARAGNTVQAPMYVLTETHARKAKNARAVPDAPMGQIALRAPDARPGAPVPMGAHAQRECAPHNSPAVHNKTALLEALIHVRQAAVARPAVLIAPAVPHAQGREAAHRAFIVL